MKVRKGNRVAKNKTAIIEIEFDCDYEIFIFQGKLSDFDILIRYKKTLSRLRTPKHIHWVVDILMKYQSDKTLTQIFIKEVQQLWSTITPLTDNNFNTLKNFANGVNDSYSANIQARFSSLSSCGEYDVEFLYFLISFLILQEKTNMPNAFMFSNIIKELLKTNIDIFRIVSTATHNGR